MRRVLSLFFLVLCLSSLQGAGSAQTRRPATFDDVMKVKAVGSPTLSPDGATVLYTVRQWEPPSDKEKERLEARTRIWRVRSDGSEPARQITFGERGDTQPQWSPDGRFISFLSARGPAANGEEGGPKPQVHVMRADGGEAQKLTDAKEGVDLVLVVSRQRAHRLPDQRPALRGAGRRDQEDETTSACSRATSATPTPGWWT